jgi:hypothetical protein
MSNFNETKMQYKKDVVSSTSENNKMHGCSANNVGLNPFFVL